MKNIACVILAAGRGTRMKSRIPKALHDLHSRPILEHLINNVKAAGVEKIVLVLGHGADEIKKRFKGFDVARQAKLLGSADAVNAAERYLKNHEGDILILYSDTPLIKSRTLKNLVAKHRDGDFACTLLTANLTDPTGYGRIIRDENGGIVKIVEEKDASLYEEAIEEINIGAYCFKKNDLFSNLSNIEFNKKKKEYYLTDIIEIFKKSSKTIGSLAVDDYSEGIGINSRKDLALANDILRKRALDKFMEEGVTIVDALSTHIDMDSKIGEDTVIYPGTIIEKDVEIGKDCRIGPFAHLRSGTRLEDNVQVGNFAELVRTTVGSGTKIKHKSYLGDTTVGRNVNIGAGAITANYDGKNKNKTVIKDSAFIGVGAMLIAPVTIGRGAVVGAGSVVTKGHDVPDGKTVTGIPARIFKKKKV